jgi:hypothetical protein
MEISIGMSAVFMLLSCYPFTVTPLSIRDACRDAGGRATHGAVAERAGDMILIKPGLIPPHPGLLPEGEGILY